MGVYVCCYCLKPCGMMGDGCIDKVPRPPVKTHEEIQAVLAKYADDYQKVTE